jgi:hypothetical protein
MSRLSQNLPTHAADRDGMEDFMNRSAGVGQRSVAAALERKRMEEARRLAAMREAGQTQRQGMSDANRLDVGGQRIAGEQALQGQRLGAAAQEGGRERQFKQRMQADKAIIDSLMEDDKFRKMIQQLSMLI